MITLKNIDDVLLTMPSTEFLQRQEGQRRLSLFACLFVLYRWFSKIFGKHNTDMLRCSFRLKANSIATYSSNCQTFKTFLIKIILFFHLMQGTN